MKKILSGFLERILLFVFYISGDEHLSMLRLCERKEERGKCLSLLFTNDSPQINREYVRCFYGKLSLLSAGAGAVQTVLIGLNHLLERVARTNHEILRPRGPFPQPGQEFLTVFSRE